MDPATTANDRIERNHDRQWYYCDPNVTISVTNEKRLSTTIDSPLHVIGNIGADALQRVVKVVVRRERDEAASTFLKSRSYCGR